MEKGGRRVSGAAAARPAWGPPRRHAPSAAYHLYRPLAATFRLDLVSLHSAPQTRKRHVGFGGRAIGWWLLIGTDVGRIIVALYQGSPTQTATGGASRCRKCAEGTPWVRARTAAGGRATPGRTTPGRTMGARKARGEDTAWPLVKPPPLAKVSTGAAINQIAKMARNPSSSLIVIAYFLHRVASPLLYRAMVSTFQARPVLVAPGLTTEGMNPSPGTPQNDRGAVPLCLRAPRRINRHAKGYRLR